MHACMHAYVEQDQGSITSKKLQGTVTDYRYSDIAGRNYLSAVCSVVQFPWQPAIFGHNMRLLKKGVDNIVIRQ